MRITLQRLAVLLIIGLFGALLFSGASRTTEPTPSQVSETPDPSDFLSLRPQLESLSSQPLSEEERAGLLYMREEEKLARDVYITLYQVWNIRVFSNISQSEQTHTESVRVLLMKYDIPDPVTNDSVGAFVNTDLAKLYTDLTARGKKSAEESLAVGAFIEDLDIADLERYITQTDNDDIRLVYENLMRGSRNHLRSFVSQLSSRGVTYTPEYITQQEFDSIISSSRETGSQGASGRGWGK